MSEKLDLFEMTIKRGLENYELPLDNSAWSEFEQGLGGAKAPSSNPMSSSSFLPKFGLAAAFLFGAVIFINQQADDVQSSHDHELAIHEDHSGDHASDVDHPVVSSTPEDRVVTISPEEEETEAFSTKEISELSISESEMNRMERINSKLQEATERSTNNNQSEPSIEVNKRSTTRYLGADFNLGAAKSFSPDDDGKNDSFLPSSLEDGDLFLMTISDESGAIVFTSSDVSQPWEGKDTIGNEIKEGRYSWEVILQKDRNKEIFKGIVNLER